MLAATVSWKSAISWLTMAICWRRDASVTSRRSAPSSRTAPVNGVEEPGNEIDEGRLPRPGRADESERLARLDDEGDVPERRKPILPVPEYHGIEFDPSLGPPELDGPPVRLFRLVEEPEHALRRGQTLLKLRINRRELSYRPQQQHHRGHEADETADGGGAGHRSMGGKGDDYPDQHRDNDLQDGARIGARHPRFEGVEAHRIGGADEAPAFVLPAAEYTYCLLRVEALAQPMVDVPHRLLDHSAQAAKPATEVADGDERIPGPRGASGAKAASRATPSRPAVPPRPAGRLPG